MARTATIERNTKETQISVQLNLDGGEVQVNTGIGFFDHMLTAFGFYAGIGLKLTAKGDLYVDGHHTVEDTGIVLGQAIREALGDRKGIRRLALPMFLWTRPSRSLRWTFPTGLIWSLTRKCRRSASVSTTPA